MTRGARPDTAYYKIKLRLLPLSTVPVRPAFNKKRNKMNKEKHLSRIKSFRVLSYIGFVLWVPVIFTSFFIIAAHGKANILLRIFCVLLIWCMPVVVLISNKLALKELNNGNIKKAYCLSCIPTGILFIPEVSSGLWMAISYCYI